MPSSEMQSRWIALIWTGKRGLPSADDMQKEMNMRNNGTKKQFLKRDRHTIQVYIHTCHVMSARFGVTHCRAYHCERLMVVSY
jgi:hypothetical protein